MAQTQKAIASKTYRSNEGRSYRAEGRRSLGAKVAWTPTKLAYGRVPRSTSNSIRGGSAVEIIK